MALYHFSVKQVSRGKGQTVVNSAAYISGQKLYNDYYGQTHDYTKKSGVVFTEILTPEYAPERLSDRETLWNEIEQIEKSKRAQLAYSFDIALQNELTLDENIELAREFCREQFVARGMIVDLAVHEGKSKNEDEPDNPHFHVLAPIRPIAGDGSWGNKQKREYVLDEDENRIKDAKGKDIFNAVSTTGWNDPELLKEWRRAWTEKVNEKFRECHMAARIDHRSYKEQGIDLIPTIHEGYEVRAMEKKGIKTIIGELNRAIRQFNQMFISLKESIQWMKTAYEEMKAELDRRQNPTLLESLQDYYDKKTQGRPPLPNFYAEMKRKGKNLSNLQEFAKSISYLQTHQIETMDDLQERIDELNGVVSVSKKEISEKREQLKKLENLEKMAEVIKINQPLIDEYNRFYFQKRREKYYQQHKKEINYYRKCEAFIDEYGRLMNRKPHRVLKELKHYVADSEMQESYASSIKDLVRDKMVEYSKYAIDRVGDVFFYEVIPNVWHKHIVPLWNGAKDVLFSKELKIDQIKCETEYKVVENQSIFSETMTKEEVDAEKRKLLYHWIGLLSSLTKLRNAGELDVESTLAQLTEPMMIERVNALLGENPNLLETDKYILLHSLLGRDLYMEGQLIPIRAAEIKKVAKNNGGF